MEDFMKIVNYKHIITAGIISVAFSIMSSAWADKDHSGDYIEYRDKHIYELQERINCLKNSENWDDWETCHEDAERKATMKHIESLKDKIRMLEEGLKEEEAPKEEESNKKE